MSPSPGETPGISLPPPAAEQLPGQAGPSGLAEQGPAAPETAHSPAAGQPAIGLPASQPLAFQPPAGSAPALPQADDSSTTKQAGLPMADDTDLIEKEWINRAKQAVERNRNDPYRQSEELTKVKADYMKQRYNKVIKMSK